MRNLVCMTIAVFLLILGIALSQLFYEDAYPTSLLYFHDTNAIQTSHQGPLMKHVSLKGEFRAIQNNLGSLKLKVTTYNRLNNDTIVFRMREKGGSEWTIQNEYATDRMPNGQLYPLGFPVIPDSKGKTYEFQLQSKNGSEGNAIGVVYSYHAFASNYIYTKKDLLGDTALFQFFLKEKFRTIVTTPEIVFLIMMCLIPFFYWCSFWFATDKKVQNPIALVLCGATVSIYLFVPVSLYSNTMLFVFFVLLAIVYRERISASMVFGSALVLLLLMFILLGMQYEIQVIRSATMVYFFMILGIICSSFRYKSKINI